MLAHFKSYAGMLAFLVSLSSCATREWEPEEMSAHPSEMSPLPDQWTLEEMSARRGSYIEIPLLPDRELCGLGLSWCKFKLHYFTRVPNETGLPQDIYV